MKLTRIARRCFNIVGRITLRLFVCTLLIPARFIPNSKTPLVADQVSSTLAKILASREIGFFRFDLQPFDHFHGNLLSGEMADTAIIISGQFVFEKNFTFTTARLLRERYPNCPIIVSGWSELSKVKVQLEKLRIHVIINEDLQNSDPFHLAQQVIGVREGLKFAKSLGSQYAVRLRADQRPMNPYFMDYLHSQLRLHPLKLSTTSLKSRILSVSDCVSLFSYGHFSDHFHFGYLDDLLLYWDFEPPLDRVPPESLDRLQVFFDHDAYNEQYLGRRFLENIGLIGSGTWFDHWAVLRDYWIILERQQIDLLWFKYDYWHLERASTFDRVRKYPPVSEIYWTGNFRHELWLLLQVGEVNLREIDFSLIPTRSTSDKVDFLDSK